MWSPNRIRSGRVLVPGQVPKVLVRVRSTAIPRMLAPRFAQNFLQLFFENHTQIQCFDVKITTKHLFL